MCDGRGRSRRGPWYPLHPATCIVLLIFGGVLLYCNTKSVDPFGGPVVSPLPSATCTLTGYTYGWPIRFFDRWQLTTTYANPARRPPVTEGKSGFSGPALVADVAVALVIIGSVVFLLETRLRSRRKWSQFGLGGLFILAAVVAAFCSIWQNWAALETAFGQDHLITRVFRFPVYVWAVLLAGVACAVYVAIWTIARTALSLASIGAMAARRVRPRR